MENLMEMEYVINGEKYLITATKVEEPTEANNTEMVEADFPAMENLEFVEVENNGLVQLPLSMVPQSMDLVSWLDVIKNYGVILTD
jgi:hypothetical protein